MTYGNAPRTQAEWDAKRAEVKAEAAEVVEANRQEALENLQSLRTAAGYPEPVTRNAVGEVEAAEAAVDALTEEQEEETEEVKPYGEWTNEELSNELKERELPHSGNKDELVARLEESDNAKTGDE